MKQVLRYHQLMGRIVPALAVTFAVGWPAAADARDVVVAKLPPEVQQAEGFAPAQSAGLFVGIRRFDDSKFL